MSRGINDLVKSLTDIQPKDVSAKVVMAIITYGKENSSHEPTRATVANMIEAKQAGGWQFVVLSADLSSIEDALNVGVRASQALAFGHTPDGMRKAMTSASERVNQYGQNLKGDVSSEESDREQQQAETRRKQQSRVRSARGI